MHNNSQQKLPPPPTTTTTIYTLPNDILLLIIEGLLDQHQASLLQLACTAKFICKTTLQKLWQRPKCNTSLALKLFISITLSNMTMFPYQDWITGLDISLGSNMQQLLSGNMFNSDQQHQLMIPLSSEPPHENLIKLKSLRIANVQATVTTSHFLINHFLSSSTTTTSIIEDIQIINCSTEITSSLLTNITTSTTLTTQQQLSRITIQDCFITDAWIQQLVNLTPQLQYLVIERSGYMISDAAILSITQHCPLIETLVVTLPSHLVQSNTITFTSIQCLSACIYLKVFVCRGQVRISNQECVDWLYHHCPLLEHCDVSFSS